MKAAGTPREPEGEFAYVEFHLDHITYHPGVTAPVASTTAAAACVGSPTPGPDPSQHH